MVDSTEPVRDAADVAYALAKRLRDDPEVPVDHVVVHGHDGCEHCGRPTDERYCDNDCRRVDKSGIGPCKVHGDDCPTIIADAG